MRQLNISFYSIKMAPENGDKTKNANKVTFFRSETKAEQSFDGVSKRTKTPFRKAQSLLVLKTKDVGISSSVLTSHKTAVAYNDDVISNTSSASTSSSSDGRGRSIRRRLPPLPSHVPGTVAPREAGLRQQQQQQHGCSARENRLSLQHEIMSVAECLWNAVVSGRYNSTGEQQVTGRLDADGQHRQSCSERNCNRITCADLLQVEAEAKSDSKIVSGSTCRLKSNRSPEEEACAVVISNGTHRPVAVRPSYDRSSSRLNIAADESSRFVEDALSSTTLQGTASVSKTTSKETLEKTKDQIERHSLQNPFFLPLNSQISSVDSDSEDNEETCGADRVKVNSLSREGGLLSFACNASKSNAERAQLRRAPHTVQRHRLTDYLTSPKAQDISTEKGHSSERDSTTGILDRKENNWPRERQTGMSLQRLDNRLPSLQRIYLKTIEANKNGSQSGDQDTSPVTSEEDDDVTQMSSKDKLVLHLSKTESEVQNVSKGGGGQSNVEWEGNRIFQSSSFPIPPSPLSLHLLLQNHRLIPVTLFGDDLGMTFAKKSLLWRHFTETLAEEFRPVATNENGSMLLGVVIVTGVAKGTAAEANGLSVGDIVVEVNGLSALHSSADDVRRLLASGRRVDLVLARSRSSLDPMTERSLYRWEENSDEVHHSTASKGRPQPTDNSRRKEFLAKYPQRFDDDNATKQRSYPVRKQMNRFNRKYLLGDDWSTMHASSTPPRRPSSFDDFPPNELSDPDFGWQKISAV